MADVYVWSGAAGANNGSSPADAYVSMLSADGSQSDDQIWVRRSHVESPAALISFSGGSVGQENFCVGWPLAGDTHFDDRPAAGISAGWDADAETHPTITSLYTAGAMTISTNQFLLERMSLSHSGPLSSAASLLNFTLTNEALAVVKKCILDRTGSTHTSAAYGCISVSSADQVLVEDSLLIGHPTLGAVVQSSGRLYLVNCELRGSVNTVNFGSDGYIRMVTPEFPAGFLPTDAIVQNLSNSQTFNLIGGNTNGAALAAFIPSAWVNAGYSFANINGAENFYAAKMLQTFESVAVARPGGSAASIRQTPTNSSLNNHSNPGNLKFPVLGYPFNPVIGTLAFPSANNMMHVTGGSPVTITMWAQTENYDVMPAPGQAFLSVEYDVDAAGNRAYAASTEQFIAKDTWTAFSVTFTPGKDGLAALSFQSNFYESGAPTRSFLFDPLPVIS